jgi:hypothetical protein
MKSNTPSRKFRKLSTLSGICLAALVVTAAGETQAQEAAPAAGGSEANSVRYNRKSGKVKSKETLDTKFKQEKEQQEKESKRKVDMMQGAEFAKKRAAVAQEIADTQIEQLKRLLKATEVTHSDYPDLLFRLSDHFLEKKAYFENQVGALYEEIYAAEEAKQNSKADSSRPSRPSSRPRPRRPRSRPSSCTRRWSAPRSSASSSASTRPCTSTRSSSASSSARRR